MTFVKRFYNKKKKVYRKKRYYKRKVNKLAIKNSPFPRFAIVKMRYATTVRLNANVTGSSSHLFRANSIADPDLTGIGHQPYGHDTYASVYNHYKVLKSRIICTYTSNGSSSSGNYVVGVALKDDNNVETDFDTIREARTAKYKIVNDENISTVTNGYNARKMFPNNVDNLNAQFSNNPSEDAIFQVFHTSCNSGVEPNSCDVVVTIEYTVKMWELKDLGQS